MGTQGVKWPKHEANRSLPTSDKENNAWSYTSTHSYVFMTWCLVKHNLTHRPDLPAYWSCLGAGRAQGYSAGLRAGRSGD